MTFRRRGLNLNIPHIIVKIATIYGYDILGDGRYAVCRQNKHYEIRRPIKGTSDNIEDFSIVEFSAGKPDAIVAYLIGNVLPLGDLLKQ